MRSMSKAVVDAQFIRNVAREIGMELSIVMRTDSAAPLANASKLGPGRIRHLELQAAYLKECVRKRYVRIEKMSGKENTSDILTKHYNADTIRRMRPKIGIITSVRNHVEVPFVKVNDWKDIIPFPDTDPTTEREIRERFGVKLPDTTEAVGEVSAVDFDVSASVEHDVRTFSALINGMSVATGAVIGWGLRGLRGFGQLRAKNPPPMGEGIPLRQTPSMGVMAK